MVSRVCYHQIPKNLKKQSDWLTLKKKIILSNDVGYASIFHKRVFYKIFFNVSDKQEQREA